MIVILKNGAAEEKKNQLIDWLKEQGLQSISTRLVSPTRPRTV